MTEMTYLCEVKCRDCGAVLNTAEGVPERERTRVTISAPLMAGKCPNGCRSTFSDCNLNTTLEWSEEMSDDTTNP